MKLNLQISTSVNVAPERVSDEFGCNELSMFWHMFIDPSMRIKFEVVPVEDPTYELYVFRNTQSQASRVLLRKVNHVDPQKKVVGEFVAYITLEVLKEMSTLFKTELFRDHPFILKDFRGKGLMVQLYEWVLEARAVLVSDGYPSVAHNLMWQRLAQHHPWIIYDAGDEYRKLNSRKGLAPDKQVIANMAKKQFGAMLFGSTWTQQRATKWAEENRLIVVPIKAITKR